MNKPFFLSCIFLSVITAALLAGCADSVSSTDKIAPSISIYSPLADSTVTYGKTYVSYDATDDQGLSYIDVYAYRKNDDANVFQGRFNVTGSTKPNVYFDLDSAQTVGKYIYYFMIVSDKSGNLKYSDTVRNIYVAKILTVPPAPYNLTITRLLNSRTFNISWSDSASYVLQYSLERRIGTNGSFTVIQTLSNGYFNTNDNGVDTTLTYYYRIRSRNEKGYSEYSNEANSSGTGNIPAPANLTVIPLTSTSDSLCWINHMVGNFIQIERRQDGIEIFTKLAVISPVSTSYVDAADLLAQVKYFYRVKVFSGNDSAWSNQASITMPAFDIPAPSSLKASVLTDTTNSKKYIRLAWKESSSLVEVTYIYRRASTDTVFSVVGEYDGPSATRAYTYDDTTAVNGVLYYYKVLARSDSYKINSPYSELVAITMPSSKQRTAAGKK